MGPTLSRSSKRAQPKGWNPVISSVLGTLIGVLLALGLRETASYGLGVLVLLGLLLALGRSGLVPLETRWEENGGVSSMRLPFLEQTIGYLLCVLWLEPPGLLALCVGFFLYRALDVFPIAPVRTKRQAGKRDQVLLGQVITGALAFCCMGVLRLLVLPGMWSVAR